MHFGRPCISVVQTHKFSNVIHTVFTSFLHSVFHMPTTLLLKICICTSFLIPPAQFLDMVLGFGITWDFTELVTTSCPCRNIKAIIMSLSIFLSYSEGRSRISFLSLQLISHNYGFIHILFCWTFTSISIHPQVRTVSCFCIVQFGLNMCCICLHEHLIVRLLKSKFNDERSVVCLSHDPLDLIFW